MTEVVKCYHGVEMERSAYKYDSNGNATEIIVYENGEKTEEKTIEYISIEVSHEQAEKIKARQNDLI